MLCCDEKSQIPALEWFQLSPLLNPGRLKTRAHGFGHSRHGTTTLVAANSYLDGKLIARLELRSPTPTCNRSGCFASSTTRCPRKFRCATSATTTQSTCTRSLGSG